MTVLLHERSRRMACRWLIIALLCSSCVWPSKALVSRWVAKMVPAERLVQNLSQEIKKRPKDGELYAQLGRVYSIWYVKGAYTREVNLWVAGNDPFTADQVILKGFRDASEYRGRNRSPIVYERALARNLERLTNSMACYEKAIELRHTNVFVFLGLGWTQHQAGRTNAAKGNYRKALKLSERYQPKLEQMGDLDVTAETAEYLLSLLDPVKDKEEYDRVIGTQLSTYSRSPQMVTPIVVPMSADAKPLREIIDWNARVYFDLDGCGEKQWQWITTNAAWLVYQEKVEEPIVSGIQMFGNVTFWMFWRNGYAALASLDNDGNGYLEGPELCHLSLWHDRDSNGKSEREELQPLDDHGIVRLSTRHRSLGNNDYVSSDGALFRDGTVRPTYDVTLSGRRE